MEKVTDVKFGPLENSIYIKPMRIFYKQDGKDKSWDIMEMHDSVAIIIYNLTRKKLLFVKQFRPSIYYINIPVELRNKPIDMDKYPASLGISLELCAGIVDKNKSLVDIAKEEVLEECGYDVPIENFEKLHTYRSYIGRSGTMLTIFYCEVTDDMKINLGGGIDDEIIEVIELSLDDCKKELSSNVVRCPGDVLIAYYWFVHHNPSTLQQ